MIKKTTGWAGLSDQSKAPPVLIFLIDKQLAYDRIYVGTSEGSGTPESALRRRGWKFLEKSSYFVSDVSIFQKAL